MTVKKVGENPDHINPLILDDLFYGTPCGAVLLLEVPAVEGLLYQHDRVLLMPLSSKPL
jgi:hypothetical protein